MPTPQSIASLKREFVQQLAEAAPRSGLSRKATQRLFQSVAEELGERELKAIAHEAVDIHTPVGDLMASMEVALDDGSTYVWHYINPLALLFQLCVLNSSFAHMMASAVAQGPARLAMYTDGTAHGNALHPDLPREMLCFYFSFKEFPRWWRSKAWGWLPFGFFPTKFDVIGGPSKLLSRVLHQFFAGMFNLVRGISLPLGAIRFTFQAVFYVIIQDEKAHKESFDLKGAAGTKFCFLCKNLD